MFQENGAAWSHRRGSRSSSVLRDCRGGVFVEFAVIAVPLLVVLFGAILAGVNLAAATALDNAARDAANSILVADSSARGTDDSLVRNLVCNRLASFVPCSSIVIYVASGPTCSSLTAAKVVNSTLSLTGYSPGAPNSCVLLQVAVSSPLGLNPLVPGNNGPMLMSTIAFMNEPL